MQGRAPDSQGALLAVALAVCPGVLLILANELTLKMGLVPLACLWFALYALNSIVEASGDANAK